MDIFHLRVILYFMDPKDYDETLPYQRHFVYQLSLFLTITLFSTLLILFYVTCLLYSLYYIINISPNVRSFI